jgi:hypothetical protein
MERATALARGFDEVTDTLKVQTERVKALPSIMPTSGWLSSEFAKSRFHPILHVTRPHNGIDLTAEIGTPIVAPAAGVVAFAGGGGELVVRVLAVESMLVEIAGDFSDWEPLPMEREGSFWVARARLRPGKHRVAVRVNLGEWRAPRNLARVRDDYGGEAGLVVVP